jgi:hypothetical protein
VMSLPWNFAPSPRSWGEGLLTGKGLLTGM